jgi:hypothetical protein
MTHLLGSLPNAIGNDFCEAMPHIVLDFGQFRTSIRRWQNGQRPITNQRVGVTHSCLFVISDVWSTRPAGPLCPNFRRIQFQRYCCLAANDVQGQEVTLADLRYREGEAAFILLALAKSAVAEFVGSRALSASVPR